MSDRQTVLSAVTSAIDAAVGRVLDVALDASKVYVTIETDAAKGAAVETMRQSAEAAAKTAAPGHDVMVILTAERKAPELKVKQPQQQFSHKISQKPVAPRVRHMVAVASGKGGVGKSTVSANLAAALAAMGLKTGLLDADIYGASQPLMMGVREKPEMDDNDMIVPHVRHGVKIMSMGFFVDPAAPVIWRGPMVHSAIQQLLRDVEWGDLDVLVIDLPPGTGDAQLSLAQYVPLSGAVIVSTPQDAALNEAVKGLRMFEKTNVPVIGMVENMSHFNCTSCGARDDIFGHGGVAKKAAEIGADFLGEVPLMSVIREKADLGMPVVLADPAHPAAQAFKNIAARVFTALQGMQRPNKAAKG